MPLSTDVPEHHISPRYSAAPEYPGPSRGHLCRDRAPHHRRTELPARAARPATGSAGTLIP